MVRNAYPTEWAGGDELCGKKGHRGPDLTGSKPSSATLKQEEGVSGEPKKTVLIVDDDELVLIHVETLLQNEGYETATAWSGVQALQLLRSSKFDLVLLDDYLPDIRIEDIVKYIQGLVSRPPVVVMQSGQPPPDVLWRFMSLGVREVVNKRMPYDQFLQAVCAWLAALPLSAAAGD